jgi:exopolysaccharide production protein ExoQ
MQTKSKDQPVRRAGVVILVLIVVTTGSYIRTRTVEESTEADWLVLLQIGLCLAGAAAGILLIRKHSAGAVAGRLLIGYCVAVIAAGAFSPYFTLVAGYWILLAGASLLLIGLVSSSETEASLRRIEFVIFGAVAVMILKDAVISWFFLDPGKTDEIYRLGENTSSANALGMIAAIAFCMSFTTPAFSNGARYRRYGWRALFALIILLTRSRVALIGAADGMFARLWHRRVHSRGGRSRILAVAIPWWAGSLVVLVVIAWTMGAQPVTAMVELVNRREDSRMIMSFTGRTEVWSYALQRIFDSLYSVVLGHGYGVSKFVLNENNWTASFFAYHAHNTFLEALLSTGLVGTVPLLLLLAYSLSWHVRFSRLRDSFSLDFMLRAVSAVTLILSYLLTESDLASKIGPITIVFLFYVLALDRQVPFKRRAREQ